MGGCAKEKEPPARSLGKVRPPSAVPPPPPPPRASTLPSASSPAVEQHQRRPDLVIAIVVMPAHLRLPHRPKLAHRLQLASARRNLTLDAPSDAHARLQPPSHLLQHRIQHVFGHEKRIDALRAAFFQPGKQHLQPDSYNVKHAPATSNLPLDARKTIHQLIKRCRYRADYLNLVTSIVAQPNEDSNFKYDACRLVCDSLFQQLRHGSHHDADPKMLMLANQIRYKLEDAHVLLPQELLNVGLLCAAVSHSLPALKLYLREHRRLDRPMSPTVFARVVDGIVHFVPKRFIRPTEWEPPLSEEQASAVMLGFPDAPVEAPYDLSSFVPRDSWDCMSRWLLALARYDFLHQLRIEWALWLENPLRAAPTRCAPTTINSDKEVMQRLVEAAMWNTKTRGDLAFVEAFCKSGGIEEAWMVLEESAFSFELLKRRTRAALLAHPEYAAPELWTDDMKAAMLDNYAAELAKIESLYGVEWVWDEEAGTGYHHISGESFLRSFEDHDKGSVASQETGS